MEVFLRANIKTVIEIHQNPHTFLQLLALYVTHKQVFSRFFMCALELFGRVAEELSQLLTVNKA